MKINNPTDTNSCEISMFIYLHLECSEFKKNVNFQVQRSMFTSDYFAKIKLFE